VAGSRNILGIFKAIGLANWRDVQSLRSIAGQNLFLFVIFVALQPESAEFFVAIFAVVMLVPLSADPMQKIPGERRATWPISNWQWGAIRLGSLALSPITWAALLLLVKVNWRISALVVAVAGTIQGIAYASRRVSFRLPAALGPARLPAPPGLVGAIMRLQWREMLRTLDPYVALALTLCIGLYRLSGKPLDPAAVRIMSLIVVLALSTESQVLFGIDGSGAERYRQLPIHGWQILLAKDRSDGRSIYCWQYRHDARTSDDRSVRGCMGGFAIRLRPTMGSPKCLASDEPDRKRLKGLKGKPNRVSLDL
jgi:hypothetical protein